MSEYSEGIVNVQQGYSEGKHKNKAKTSINGNLQRKKCKATVDWNSFRY